MENSTIIMGYTAAGTSLNFLMSVKRDLDQARSDAEEASLRAEW